MNDKKGKNQKTPRCEEIPVPNLKKVAPKGEDSTADDAEKERPELGTPVVAVVVPPCVLVQVAPKVLLGYRMVDAIDAPFHQRPESLHRVDMNVAAYKDTRRVIDPFVVESITSERVMRRQFGS